MTRLRHRLIHARLRKRALGCAAAIRMARGMISPGLATGPERRRLSRWWAKGSVEAELSKSRSRSTISPQSKFLGRWDVATALALLWTAFVTPFEVGFLSTVVDYASPLFIINRLVDLVFIVDIILAFFLTCSCSAAGRFLVRFDSLDVQTAPEVS